MLLFLTACARVHGPDIAEAPHVAATREPARRGPATGAPPDGAPPDAARRDGALPDADSTAAPPLHVLDEHALAELLRNAGAEPLVVNFWATWCGPCGREMEVFRTVAAEAPDARFALVSVDEARDRPAVLPFLSERGVATLPAYHLDAADPSGVLARTVEGWPNLIPVTLVIEPGGAVRARFDGILDETALRAALSD